MIVFLRRLMFGCWRSHGDQLRERRASGYWMVCQRCGCEQPILQTETLKGPRHQQDPIPGQPTGKACKVSPFTKTQRRVV